MYVHTTKLTDTTEENLRAELERMEGRLEGLRNDLWVLRLRLQEALREKERLERHLSTLSKRAEERSWNSNP